MNVPKVGRLGPRSAVHRRPLDAGVNRQSPNLPSRISAGEGPPALPTNLPVSTVGATDHLDHQPHERLVFKAQVASADGFKAAVLINYGLDVLHGRLVWGWGSPLEEWQVREGFAIGVETRIGVATGLDS